MGPSFFGINAGQAYNVAGSFCRFLYDTRGAEKLERLYRAAGADESWREIYGVDFASLRDEWLRVIDAQTVPAAERAVALERLKRPSVFRRPCAHAQALRKVAARAAAQAGDRGRALAEWDAVCADDDSAENALERAEAIVAAGDYVRAAAELERLDKRVDEVTRARLLMLRGDVDVLRGATPDYDALAALPLEESVARLATVKRDVSKWPPSEARTAILQILAAPAGTRDAALDLVTLQKLADAGGEHTALLDYLLGRQLYGRGRFADAADALGRSLAGPLPDGRFIREAVRMRGAALFRLGKRAEAREIFQAISFDPNAPEGARLDAKVWVARCDFRMP
jgi:tetratricopeptide (TPR) repeat protein